MAPAPQHVLIETIDSDARLRTPYRGIATGRATLRLTVSPGAVRIDVDDMSIEVSDRRGCFAVTAIDAIFVVERQPPAWRFLTWFGVFVRRHGLPDQLIVETPDRRVARYIERVIEERLGLRDEPVRGEAPL